MEFGVASQFVLGLLAAVFTVGAIVYKYFNVGR